MRVLFITRKYPPQIGGMESFSYGLINNVKCEKETIILNKSQINLIWWLPFALIIALMKSRRADCIHLCDGLLAPIGLVIKKIYHKPISVTVHGLDITYQNFIYQKICVNSLKYLDKIICVSNSTKQDCLNKNIPENKLFVIPNGVNVNVETRHAASLTKNTKNNKRILLTIGRLIKRKGVTWFIENVMPKLGKDFEYWVVGKGPEKENIEKIIEEKNLHDRVKLLGFIDDKKLKELYFQADVFIMPNIQVEGDREGFGIVALEAGSYGLPVLASNLEGIKDVVKDGVNGYLIEAENSQEWVDKIENLRYNTLLRKDIIEYINNNFSWSTIVNRYKTKWLIKEK